MNGEVMECSNEQRGEKYDGEWRISDEKKKVKKKRKNDGEQSFIISFLS